ncbi:adenosine deaminase [Dermacoccus sp. PE3]|uniref:adenosine deaminase n=1 Tax=Dermacoccus TaxID=57495 RepID=UPI000642033F|nr:MULTISPECIES: adenosine deaminase [Dermacoccus]KLO62545.1 adenosine deaminase [Dermacoccus sp. PE3]
MSDETTKSTLSEDVIARLPKVVLHDHLDGGVRPATVLELARETDYDALPADDEASLAAWFRDSADSGSLERYLETFAHTVGVMQTREAIERVARECALDHSNDGVVYAEVRFAPELHIEQGLGLDEVVDAVLAGFEAGARESESQGRPIVMRALLTAMRHAAKSVEIAELAVAYRDQGVVGFDIAGAEAGFPPTRHLDAFEYLRRENAHFTIHAGEAFGLPSIWEAIQYCGAERLGHGVRITDDISVDGVEYGELDEPARAALPARVRTGEADVRLGRLAAFVRDRRIALEVCPRSNLQTGAALSLRSHPISLLLALGFRVALSTDNRLMSDTSMTKEMTGLVREAGWTLADLEKVTVNAMKSAFVGFDERLDIIMTVIKPAYAVARGQG